MTQAVFVDNLAFVTSEHETSSSWWPSLTYPGLMFVATPRAMFYAVTDDFGNLVKVPG